LLCMQWSREQKDRWLNQTPMDKSSTTVEVPEECIVVVFDLDYPEGTRSMKRHIDAFPLGYVQVEIIAHLAIVCMYPGGAMELLT
jgi:hypothetical protein